MRSRACRLRALFRVIRDRPVSGGPARPLKTDTKPTAAGSVDPAVRTRVEDPSFLIADPDAGGIGSEAQAGVSAWGHYRCSWLGSTRLSRPVAQMPPRR